MQKNSTWTSYEFLKPELPQVCNPTILAFSCYFHDSSACIVQNGKIVAAVDEERFSRRKHDASFPRQAIQFCLKQINMAPVDFVVFYENPDIKWARIEQTLKLNPPSDDLRARIYQSWREVKSKDKIQEIFSQETAIEKPIVFLDHHLCHAASSYFVSGFDQSAVVTIDGVGEKVTTSFGIGTGSDLALSHCIHFPHSIGLLYTMVTVFLGMKANDHEYKIMGLAPYGCMDREKNPYYALIKQVMTLHNDGSFSLNMQYFGHQHFGTPPYTRSFIDLIGMEPLKPHSHLSENHKNLAAALQMLTEDAVFNLLNQVRKITKMDNLCLSGGVALNSVLNGKILSKTGFSKLFIQPSAGDSGTVVGAAKYVQHLVDPQPEKEHFIHSSYGPSFSAGEVASYLQTNKIQHTKFESYDKLIYNVAQLLNQKKVIGWFQGSMEWGPRALGNRSILASPLFSDMRDILNAKVKHRELFRPFAPVICRDDVQDYFDADIPIPEPTDYMLMVYPIKKSVREKIPAVTHIDGSGRLQSVCKQQNPLYYKLIKAVGELTGIPILVNTSFNIRGEPIVCTPHDAFKCMMGTEIDFLVMDSILIERSKNMKFAWCAEIDD